MEALISLTWVPPSAYGMDALKSLAEQLADRYPAREELRSIGGQFFFDQPDNPTATAFNVASGFKLTSADGRWVAQLRPDGLSISRLAPYTCWEDVLERAKALFEVARCVFPDAKIDRVGVRYINQIPMSSGDDLTQYFTTTLTVSPSVNPNFAAFLLRFVLPFEAEKCVAFVTQTLESEQSGCIFDIDVIGQAEGEPWERLEALRRIKNRIFSGTMTETALERFK